MGLGNNSSVLIQIHLPKYDKVSKMKCYILQAYDLKKKRKSIITTKGCLNHTLLVKWFQRVIKVSKIYLGKQN